MLLGTTSVRPKWHLKSSNGFSMEHMCDRQHTHTYTDHATVTCRNRQICFQRCHLEMYIIQLFWLYYSYEAGFTSDAALLSSFLISSTSADILPAVTVVSVAPGWWLRRWRCTYLSQRKGREHTGHIWLGAPPCWTLRWRCRELRRENVNLHSLQTSSTSRLRYLSGRRWGCVQVRWLIRLASRANWRPQPSHVCWNLRSCNCRLWIFNVSALPSNLPHWSQRCSMAPRWTVKMWSFSCASLWNVREQYSHTNNFCAWSRIAHKSMHYIQSTDCNAVQA